MTAPKSYNRGENDKFKGCDFAGDLRRDSAEYLYCGRWLIVKCVNLAYSWSLSVKNIITVVQLEKL